MTTLPLHCYTKGVYSLARAGGLQIGNAGAENVPAQ
jgi:hypothetical protein